MSKRITKNKIFTYAVLFDIVRSAISQASGETSTQNELSIFNSMVGTIKKHKETEHVQI